MEASSSRSDSFSHGWLRCKARPAPPSFADAGALGHFFNSSTSFIDMDPAELFSMRWTSASAAEEEDDGFDFGLPCADDAQCSSPLLVGAGRDGHLLLPYEPTSTYADVSPSSSPAFYTAQSTPASAISSRFAGPSPRGGAKEPLLATRRILLRYLRFLAPLCRKVRALAPRSGRALASTTSSSSARQSTSTSSYASAAEYWCHGHADTAVRDAILYCKKSIEGQDV